MEFRDPFATTAQSYGQSSAQSKVTYDAGLRAYMLRIYNYMASALALTGIVALGAANSPAVMSLLYNAQNGHVGLSGIGILVAIAPLGLVFWLGRGIQSMSVAKAQGIFWAFAVLIGLSMSSIFLIYTGESIARTFFVTSGTFGAMSIYGYSTKSNLSGFGSFLIMGLIGLFLAMIVNMFLHSSGLAFAISIIGVLIFVGLTAYDTQKLKAIYNNIGGGADMVAKVSIMGALTLYLDFINMFRFLLNFLGDRR